MAKSHRSVAWAAELKYLGEEEMLYLWYASESPGDSPIHFQLNTKSIFFYMSSPSFTILKYDQ